MKKCPYCAEENPRRRDQVPVLLQRPAGRPRDRDAATSAAAGVAAGSPSVDAPATASPTPAASTSAPAGSPSVQYTHSGFRYVLGYAADSFGIWDRQAPGGPVETFPRTDDGWRSAWIRFVSLEPNHQPVGASGPQQIAAPTGPQSGAQTAPAPDPSDDQVSAVHPFGVELPAGLRTDVLRDLAADRPLSSSRAVPERRRRMGRRMASIHDDRVELRRGRPRKLGLRVAPRREPRAETPTDDSPDQSGDRRPHPLVVHGDLARVDEDRGTIVVRRTTLRGRSRSANVHPAATPRPGARRPATGSPIARLAGRRASPRRRAPRSGARATG